MTLGFLMSRHTAMYDSLFGRDIPAYQNRRSEWFRSCLIWFRLFPLIPSAPRSSTCPLAGRCGRGLSERRCNLSKRGGCFAPGTIYHFPLGTEHFEDFINPNSLVETTGYGDPALRTLNKGDRLQVERKGYYIVDSPFMYPNTPIVLILIPDGTAATK